MRFACERERNRTNRTGDPFALIAFTSRFCEGCREPEADTLATAIQQRVRNFDAVGWLDENRIGALLCGASRQAAYKVAEDVCQSVPEGYVPQWEIYTYPERDSDDRADEQNGGRHVALPARHASPDVAGPSVACCDGNINAFFVKPMPWPKRIVDIVGATVGLAISGPIILLAAIAIRLTSPGPIFFSQWRAGRGGKPFRMYKLRSMVVDAEAKKSQLMELNEQDGPAFKIENDPRLTRVGRILRKLSIDEMPQFWNVLIGDMSLVGPRPLPCHEMDRAADWQRTRLDVTPGLTCFWQVVGRSRVSFEEWMRLDHRYIRQQSLATDASLIARTIPAVIRGHGAK
jgi:lipopolysaccharide/colanic/teichoic acid biosynthesis glycosyltransferase